MKVAQIAQFLNETAVPQFLGVDDQGQPTATLTEDLSNFLDFGRAFIDNATDDDVDNFIKKLADKVGKQIFVSREYEPLRTSLVRDGSEWGSVVEKTRIIPRDFEENFVWELTAGTKYDEFLTFKPNDAEVKYYNKKVTYRVPLEITRKQVRGAMTGADAFVRFVGALEQTVANQMSLAYEIMSQRLVNGMIVSHADNTINLKTLYTQETGITHTTVPEYYADSDFLRWATAKIMDYSNLMTRMSNKYNDGTVPTFTPKEFQHLTLISPFSTALDTELYSQTFHNEFLKLIEHDTVPFWQNVNVRGKIKTKPLDDPQGTDVSVVNIIGILYDRDAMAVFNHEKYTTSFVNPDTTVTRYNHFEDLSLYADTAENFLVFTLN